MLKLTASHQKVYDYLHELLTVHSNVSISKELLTAHLDLSLTTVRRAIDVITLGNMNKYGLDNIYSFYIGNMIVYSLNEFANIVNDMNIHVILNIPKEYKILHG